MRINEDYIEQDNIIGQMTSDVSDENPVFIMQNRRPLKDLLKDWKFIIHFEVSNYWDNVQGTEAMRQVEEMVIQCTTRLRAAIERLPYNVEMSQFVVGSGMTESQWDASSDGGGFTQYKTYLLEHTDDDKGIQRITKIFFGINLDQNTLNLQKSFIVLSQVAKLIFKIAKVQDFLILYNSYLWQQFYINSGDGIGNNMVKSISCDMENACVQEEPNFYGIDRWMEMLCVFAGYDRKEMKYYSTMEEIKKFREMLRKKF